MFYSMLKYFIIQRVASILILMSFILGRIGPSFLKDFLNTPLLWLAILIKIGLFPFFSWIFSVGIKVPLFTITLLITLQKVPGMFVALYMHIIKRAFIIRLLLINSIIAIYLGIYFKKINIILLTSSMFGSFWFLFTINFNWTWYLSYFVYSFGYFLIRKAAHSNSDSLSLLKLDSHNFTEKGLLFAILLNLISVPPTPNFMVKVLILTLILGRHSSLLVLFFLLSRRGFIVVYIKIWWITSIYMLKKKEVLSNSYSSIYVNVIILLSFLLFRTIVYFI